MVLVAMRVQSKYKSFMSPCLSNHHLLQSARSESYREAEEHFARWLAEPVISERVIQDLNGLPEYPKHRLHAWLAWAREHHFLKDESEQVESLVVLPVPSNDEEMAEYLRMWSLYEQRVHQRLKEIAQLNTPSPTPRS